MRRKTLALAVTLAACLGSGTAAAQPVPLTVPALDTVPAGELGSSIVRGRHYLQRTAQLLPDFVGDGLSCRNCHLGNGTEVGVIANAAPLVGVVARFPQHSARDGAVITIEQRINACFERSMNGRPLPLGAPAMVDMVAYLAWLSQGVPVGARVAGQGVPELALNRAPDTDRGGALYRAKCASCHGATGGGMTGPDDTYVIPPLAGSQSFNQGAGMARYRTAAGFIKYNMPLGAAKTLTDGEAWDLAGFIDTLPRPAFPSAVAPHPAEHRAQENGTN